MFSMAGAGRDRARGVQAAPQGRGRHLRRPAGRLRRAQAGAGDRARAARGVRLRVRVPDGAHEPAAQAADRDRVHDAGRAVHLHQLAPHQGSVCARRTRARPGAGARRTAPQRERAGEEAHEARGPHLAHCRIADDESGSHGRSPPALGRRGDRFRRRRAGLLDARRDQGRGAPGARRQFHALHAGGRHRRPEEGDLRSLPGRLRRRLHREPGHRHRRRQAGALQHRAVAVRTGRRSDHARAVLADDSRAGQARRRDAGVRAHARRGRLRGPRAGRSSTPSRRARAASSSTRRATRPARSSPRASCATLARVRRAGRTSGWSSISATRS